MFWFWSSVCFLSWRIGVKCERSQEDFPICGSISTPRCIFKRSARRIFSTPALTGRNILVLSPKLPTEILKLTPQRQHASELLTFADFFGVREKFFHLTFIRLNLLTILSNVHLKTLNFKKCLEIHNCIATRNWYHISLIWQVLSPGEEIVNWFD